MTPAPASEFRALLTLAWPLVLSFGFTTIQITIDRFFLSRLGPEAAAAAMTGAMLFWVPFVLFYMAVNYVSTFVAQYVGSGRPERAGAAVWQGIYFALAAGLLMLAVSPFSAPLMSLTGHPPHVAAMEADYFRCLCWHAPPSLIVAAVCAFVSGRDHGRWVLLINGVAAAVNSVLAYAWVFGNWGFPALGVAGAGWAIVVATWAAAATAVAILLRKRYRDENATGRAWRFERRLFRRLLRFGLPSALQWMLDVTAFTAFIVIAGLMGTAEHGATTIAWTINNFTFIPMIGLGQAVAIRVGQLLGADRPERAQAATYAAFRAVMCYMLPLCLLFVTLPGPITAPFLNENAAAGLAGTGARPADLRGVLFAVRRDQHRVRVRPARGRRHRLRVARVARPGVAGHGHPVLPRVPLRLGAVLGVVLRRVVHRRPVAVLRPAVPRRQVEVDARGRAEGDRRRRVTGGHDARKSSSV